MFKLTTLFSGLFLLLYLYAHMVRSSFIFFINDALSISSFLKFLVFPPILHVSFLLVFLILICGIIFKGRYIRYLAYFCSLLIINLCFIITFDILALKNMTTFYLIQVYHPVPLMVKLSYLEAQMSYVCDSIRIANAAVPLIEDILSNSSVHNLIFVMDASEITEYARKVVYTASNIYENPTSFGSSALFNGAAFVGIMVFISTVYDIITNLRA